MKEVGMPLQVEGNESYRGTGAIGKEVSNSLTRCALFGWQSSIYLWSMEDLLEEVMNWVDDGPVAGIVILVRVFDDDLILGIRRHSPDDGESTHSLTSQH